MAGRIVSKKMPVIVPDAKAPRVNGAIFLHVVIGADGTVESVEWISGPKWMRPAVMDAVRQWTYRPYLVNGVPVEVDTTITLNIGLNGDAWSDTASMPK